MSKSSARQKQCLEFQDKMAKKRERDYWHQRKWGDQVQYYKKWEKANTKFDEWTSPRYYESNNELVERLKNEREKSKKLDERRAKLKKLLDEDDATYEIEIMMAKTKVEVTKQTKFEDIPTELLKDVNVGLKLEDDQKRRREAELQLYHQWSNSNPTIKEAERRRNVKDVKLSWLDQQIEKRMAKEKEEEECRRVLKERDKNIAEQKKQEEIMSEELKQKNKELQEYLLKQIEDINLKQKLSEELQEEEKEEFEKQRKLAELEEKQKMLEAKRRTKECALQNLKQYKIKLKSTAREIEENLEIEAEFAKQILNSQAAERIKNQATREEVKRTLDEFLEFTKEQRQLEKRRQEYLDFVFDSEAKMTYEKQKEFWDQEQRARQNLIRDVLDTIGDQIKENIKKNKEKQKEVLSERERMLADVEKYEKELEENKKFEEQKKNAFKKELDQQIAEKKAKEKKLKQLEKKTVEVELENIRMEEERLKKEIMKIQNTHAPLRYARRKPWH